MNSHDAYRILGLAIGAGKEEVKKAFRKKAAKAHPDVGGSETEFKKINAAYQLLENPPVQQPFRAPNPTHQNYQPYRSGDSSGGVRWKGVNVNFEDALQDILYKKGFRPPRKPVSQVKVTLSLSFEESVLGCSRDITFDKTIACAKCDFTGTETALSEDNCIRCEGKGFRSYQSNNQKLPCITCKGTGKKVITKICSVCKGKVTTTEKRSLKVSIPGGVSHGNHIRLPGQGDQVIGFSGYFSDAFINIKVIPDDEMNLVGADVVSSVEVSLLEALEGVSKTVNTIKGEYKLKIPPRIKHNVKLRIAGLGVPHRGDHLFTVEITYPDDEKLEKVIEALRDDISIEEEEVEDGYQ